MIHDVKVSKTSLKNDHLPPLCFILVTNNIVLFYTGMFLYLIWVALCVAEI